MPSISEGHLAQLILIKDVKVKCQMGMSKYVKKVRNIFLREEMVHHKNLHPCFSIRDTEAGYKIVVWRGKEICRVDMVTRAHKHPGDKCYIVANGPSVADLNVKQLDAPCYGVNGTIAKFRGFEDQLAHYEISDPSFFEKRFEMVEEVLNYNLHYLFTYDALNRICERDASLLIGKNISLYSLVNRRYCEPSKGISELFSTLSASGQVYLHDKQDPMVGFSLDPGVGVFGGRTVAFQAVQNAFQMGYKKIFLLGVDLGGEGNVRFYESDQNAAPRKSRLDKDFEPIIKPAFECAAKAMNDGLLEIYNLSLGSRLPAEIIPKMPLSKAKDMS